MQEVVKRMQEKQEKMKEAKHPDRVTLCIVRWHGDNYPVVMPKMFRIEPGDLVWFKAESGSVCGDVIYVDDYCEPDGTTWTLATITTGKEPIRATRYAPISELKWED